jgi:hypothetical protein
MACLHFLAEQEQIRALDTRGASFGIFFLAEVHTNFWVTTSDAGRGELVTHRFTQIRIAPTREQAKMSGCRLSMS